MNQTRTITKTQIAAFCIGVSTLLALFAMAFSKKELHALELHFNAYAIPSAVTLVVCVGLLAYFLRKPARTDERIWLAVYLSGLAVYTFGEVMQRLSATPEAALFWLHVRDPATIIAPALYLFTLTYTDRSERRHAGMISLFIISALSFIVFYTFTNLLYINVPAAMQANPWGYTPKLVDGGVGITLLLIDGLYVLSLITLIVFRKHTTNPILRKQSMIFIVALGANIVIPTFTDGIMPAIGVPIPALGVTLSTITGAIIIYGLVRYQLLTINPTLLSDTILGIVQESIAVIDDKFHILYLNSKAESLLGTRVGNRELPLEHFMTHDGFSTFKQAFVPAFTSNQAIDLGHVDVAKNDAAPVPVRVNSSALNLGGQPVRVIAFTDITNELHTQSIIEHEVVVRTEQLNRARAYLVSSINSLEQGFILVDRNSKIELVNKIATRLFGAPAEPQGTHVIEITRSMKWNVDIPDIVHKVMDTRKTRIADATSEDGSYYHIFVTPILADDHVLGAAVVVEDVTEQKILDRSKDEFFSIASHELRTPLTAIRGNMSMLRDYFGEALKDDDMRGLVDDTQSASVRLIEIVNDFLDSSRLEQGKMVFTFAPVTVATVLASVREDLTPLMKEQQDTLVYQDIEKLPQITADEGRFRQIVYNLLSNALKYCQNGTVTVSGAVEKNMLKLSFTDTGKGIPPEGQKLLFHKFQQAGESILTRDNTKGTGLGLYISRLLATNMHGTVELAHTEVDKGSTFVLTMPLAANKG